MNRRGCLVACKGGLGFPHHHEGSGGHRRKPLVLACRFRLLQRGVDGVELGAQAATDAIDRTDDRERNAGCNQAVFNSGRAGFIIQETRDKVLHS